MDKHYYGRIKSRPDPRDHLYSTIKPAIATLPVSVDLRALCSPVRDQGQLGSCTAFAMGSGLREFLEINGVPGPVPPPPAPEPSGCLARLLPGLFKPTPAPARSTPSFTVLSPLFLYYQERVLEGTVNIDNGAEIRDGMKVLNQMGIPPETDWPYDISKFTQKPPDQATADAAGFKIASYHSLSGLDEVKTCLASNNGVVLGFTVYSSFESAEVATTGVMPVPAPGEEVLGGHAVFAVGYKDDASLAGGGRLIVKNSWGSSWGDQGYFYMPYQIVLNGMADELWTGLL
jgi:C1A family cysteine protease